MEESSTEKKRDSYISWSDYFMAVAFLAAKRSKDPVTQVGACIVNHENRIMGIGYNGMPNGCSDDDFPWGKSSSSQEETKGLYGFGIISTVLQVPDPVILPDYVPLCHAEMNAILNKNSADVRGCSIYVSLFPCNECAKIIIQSGIKEVIYLSDDKKDKPSYKASKRMFQAANVNFWHYEPGVDKIVIDFTSPSMSDSTLESDMDKVKINESY